MRAPQPLGSWEPFCSKPILAAPSEGCAGSQLTVWGGEKFPRERVKWLWGGLFPEGQCRASWQIPPPCPPYAHTHKPWPHRCQPSLQLHMSQGFSASTLLAPGSDPSLSGGVVEAQKGQTAHQSQMAIKSQSLSGIHSANILYHLSCSELYYRHCRPANIYRTSIRCQYYRYKKEQDRPSHCGGDRK